MSKCILSTHQCPARCLCAYDAGASMLSPANLSWLPELVHPTAIKYLCVMCVFNQALPTYDNGDKACL